MKKAFALMLALTFVFTLAACSGKEDSDKTTQEQTGTTKFEFTTPQYTWPSKDNALFGDVPAPKGELSYYNETNNDAGRSYEFGVKKLDYDKFTAYIADLKKAGFSYYDASGLGMAATEPTLPAALSDGVTSASWLGSRRGLYISAIYSADSLKPEYALRITFYAYNPFE